MYPGSHLLSRLTKSRVARINDSSTDSGITILKSMSGSSSVPPGPTQYPQDSAGYVPRAAITFAICLMIIRVLLQVTWLWREPERAGGAGARGDSAGRQGRTGQSTGPLDVKGKLDMLRVTSAHGSPYKTRFQNAGPATCTQSSPFAQSTRRPSVCPELPVCALAHVCKAPASTCRYSITHMHPCRERLLATRAGGVWHAPILRRRPHHLPSPAMPRVCPPAAAARSHVRHDFRPPSLPMGQRSAPAPPAQYYTAAQTHGWARRWCCTGIRISTWHQPAHL